MISRYALILSLMAPLLVRADTLVPSTVETPPVTVPVAGTLNTRMSNGDGTQSSHNVRLAPTPSTIPCWDQNGNWVGAPWSMFMGQVGPAGPAGATGSSGIVTVTAPLTNSGTSTSANLSVSAATASIPGSMSAADKAKLDAFPAYAAPVINNTVTRSLGANYTISTTRAADVTYTVRISYAVTALLGSTGEVDLQHSTDGGTTWILVNDAVNNITLGVVLSGYNDYTLHGRIPAGALVRLLSTSTNATNTYRTGQEVLL